MAFAITRLTDKCSGHGCWPPRPNDEASDNVICNELGVHREGDHWPSHCCGPNCHDSHLAKGHKNIIVNGKGISFTGAPVACGSVAMEGSINTFCSFEI